MSAVASNSDGRRLIVAGSLLCFRHEHRERGTAFPPLRGKGELGDLLDHRGDCSSGTRPTL
jgi:hypothetical protein